MIQDPDLIVGAELLPLLTADAQAGCICPVTFYLAAFPGFEDEVARLFHRLVSESPCPFLVAAQGSWDDAQETARDIPAMLRQYGEFRVEGLIGSGGQGQVYRVRRLADNGLFALKIYHHIPGAELRARRCVERELSVSRLGEGLPIPAVLGGGTSTSGQFVISEFIDGETLQSWLDRRRSEIGVSEPRGIGLAPLRLRELLHRCVTLARELHRLHSSGLVHRDLKPSNIIWNESGEPTFLDFGSARAESADVAHSESSLVLGTPSYASPEQILGTNPGCDFKTDIWSLGVIIYELTTLSRPFESPSRDGLYHAILLRPHRDPCSINPDLPSGWNRVLARALQKNSELRQASAEELATELELAIRGDRMDSWAHRAVRLMGRGRRWRSVLALGVVCGMLALAALAAERSDSRSMSGSAFHSVAIPSDERLLELRAKGLVPILVPPRMSVRVRVRSFGSKEASLSVEYPPEGCDPDRTRDRIWNWNSEGNHLPYEERARGDLAVIARRMRAAVFTEFPWKNESDRTSILWLRGEFKERSNDASAPFLPMSASVSVQGVDTACGFQGSPKSSLEVFVQKGN